MKNITAKLGNMRKPAEFIVYPRKNDDNQVVIQSDRRMCIFDKNTGKGRLSPACNYPVFISTQLNGSQKVTVPQDVIDAAVNATPKSGDAIGGGVYLA